MILVRLCNRLPGLIGPRSGFSVLVLNHWNDCCLDEESVCAYHLGVNDTEAEDRIKDETPGSVSSNSTRETPGKH